MRICDKKKLRQDYANLLRNKNFNLLVKKLFFNRNTILLPNYKVSLSKLNVNVCKREFTSAKTISRPLGSLFLFYRQKSAAMFKTGSRVLFIITYREWLRARARGEEGSRCVVSARVFSKKTIPYNRFLGRRTRRRTTENSVSFSPHELTRSDGIKSSKTKRGWRHQWRT